MFFSGTECRIVCGNETSGIIEVYNEGEWRSVCDDYWTDIDADVACGCLGFLPFGEWLQVVR